MPKIDAVQSWLQDCYDLNTEDAEYLAGLVMANNRSAIIESFTPDDVDEDVNEIVIVDQVDRLMNAYGERFKSDRPRPKPKPLTFLPAEPSPNAGIEEEDTHTGVVKETFKEVPPKDKTKRTRATKGASQPEVVKSQPKHQRKVPEVKTTDTSAPPEYPLSHGMGVGQIHLLIKLIESIKDKPFDRLDPKGGGISLDDARPAFATLLMRGGVCEVVDAIKIKKSGKKYWSKKVIPIMPMAQNVIDDFKRRKSDKWKAIKGMTDA